MELIMITKIEAATEQMDWAIRLIIDHCAYLPAITLAGAAEEIIGRALQQKSVSHQLTDKFVTDFGMTKIDVTQGHLNKARNWLKHWHDYPNGDTLSIDLEHEAIQYIVRALTNLALYDGTQPSEGPRLWNWLESHHPELAAA